MTSSQPRVGVYLQPGACTMTSDVFPVLAHFGYLFRCIGDDELRSGAVRDLDVLLLPGGWYFFKGELAENLRQFVAAGGGYVGICCGAINACKLGLIAAELISMNGIGPVMVEVVDGGHPVLAGVAKLSGKAWRKYEPIDMLRYNGYPMLLGDAGQMLAAYDSDKKWAAIAAADYGQGKVVAFSTHPEGAVFAPGQMRDRDRHNVVYDGLAMGTAAMLDNALRWAARRPGQQQQTAGQQTGRAGVTGSSAGTSAGK